MTLHETSWRPASDPNLTRSLLPWVEEPEDYDQAYAVYVRPEQRVLLGGVGTFDPVIGTPFQEHLHRHRFAGLWDATFVADSFTMSDPPYSPSEQLDFDFAPVPIVDELLQDSRGVLIWHHQLESLYAMFGHTAAECVALRRSINKKEARAFEDARRFECGPDVSLEDVIQDQMRFGAVKCANLRAGRMLLAAAPSNRG